MEDMQYKKILAYVLHEDALRRSKEELIISSFYDESTTENWTLQTLQIESVKDEINFFEGGNLEDEVEETWKKVFNNEGKANES